MGVNMGFESPTSPMTNTQSPFRGVRTSKFRHVYGQAVRKEKCYENVKITKSAHDSQCCAVNPKFLAIITEVAGGGSFVVLSLEMTGRLDLTTGKVTGHTGPVMDLKWNPFNDNVIASSSEDCTVKLWYIPDEGLTGNLTEWLVDLQGHSRRVSYIEWHPTAENILVSAGFDHLIIVWNISKGEAVNVIDCHLDVIYSMSFNRDGSLLATTCKDKKLRIIEPRTGQLVQEGQCHQGNKAAKVVFLGDTGRLFTTGFSRSSERQYAVWSADNLSAPLRIEMIDASSGILFPYYDHDTKLVYVAGKGDGNVRYYELTDEAPWIYFLSQYLSGSPQRGLGSMPKRGCNTAVCEVFRFYKLHATRGLCEPISMIVPRKSEMFQDDLYPDTAAPTPSLTAEEWISGCNKGPILWSLKTGSAVVRTSKPAVALSAAMRPHMADKNNERKFAFIAQETVVDYRPLERAESGFHEDLSSATDDSDLEIPGEIICAQYDPNRDELNTAHQHAGRIRALINMLEQQRHRPRPFHRPVRTMRPVQPPDRSLSNPCSPTPPTTDSTKLAKTSTNFATKFQQTRQVWGRPVRSMTQLSFPTPASLTNGKLQSKSYSQTGRTSLAEFLNSQREINIVESSPPTTTTSPQSAGNKTAPNAGDELRNLRNQLTAKDQRIAELEEQVQRLQKQFTAFSAQLSPT